MTRSLLIIDDDPRVLASLPGAISGVTDRIRTASSAETGLKLLDQELPTVVLSDVRMPGMDGIELLQAVRKRTTDVAVILMTAFDDLPTISQAMRHGAADFLVKPLEMKALRTTLVRAFEDAEARQQEQGSPSHAGHDVSGTRMIGRHPSMVEVFKAIGLVSASRTNVVVRGESGTGKELVARAIHEASPYADQPFIAVNCTALPSTLLESELFGHRKGAFTGATKDRPGRFGAAGRGTVFLDEIGDTSQEFQAKLLRVLQEREYYPVGSEQAQATEARVIAATHRDLEQRVGDGSFRQDLYYRLRVVEIRIPPLRDRIEDIPLLAEHLIQKICIESERPAATLSENARLLLTSHDWPGNVRELENALARALVLATGSVIHSEHLDLGPDDGFGSADGLESLEDVERRHVEKVLLSTSCHKSETARILGISRPRLDRLIEKYGLTSVFGKDSGSTS